MTSAAFAFTSSKQRRQGRGGAIDAMRLVGDAANGRAVVGEATGVKVTGDGGFAAIGNADAGGVGLARRGVMMGAAGIPGRRRAPVIGTQAARVGRRGLAIGRRDARGG